MESTDRRIFLLAALRWVLKTYAKTYFDAKEKASFGHTISGDMQGFSKRKRNSRDQSIVSGSPICRADCLKEHLILRLLVLNHCDHLRFTPTQL